MDLRTIALCSSPGVSAFLMDVPLIIIRPILLRSGSRNTALRRACLTTECRFCVLTFRPTVALVTVRMVRLANLRLMLLMVNSPWHRPTSVPVGRARTLAKLLIASLLSMSAIGS